MKHAVSNAMPLTLAEAERLLATTTTDPHLLLHARNVRGCMEAFARHFGQPPEEVELATP